MSRLSDILGVPEGNEFKYGNMDSKYKVQKEFLYYKDGEAWKIVTGTGVYLMIENPKAISFLTEKQITAIKGRIAEGTPWAARTYKEVWFFSLKPIQDDDNVFTSAPGETLEVQGNAELYNFITYENSPVYLPELIEGSEEE